MVVLVKVLEVVKINKKSPFFIKNGRFLPFHQSGSDGDRMLAGKIPVIVFATPRLQTQSNVVTPASTVQSIAQI
jgi:hypothetical protein